MVNGHSFKEKKSPNTNLAILVSHNFTEPFNQPIAYAQKVGELTNMLGAGHIMVQRYGDILDGKRTWAKELAQSNVKPTLKDAVAGDITAAMPYRAMTNIIEFIKMLAKHSPGSSLEVLLYAIARHLVVGHDSAVENLLSVGAIALIFIVRKFFFVPAFGAHLPDGHPAPDLTPAQSGIPADWFRRRHSEAKPEEETETKE